MCGACSMHGVRDSYLSDALKGKHYSEDVDGGIILKLIFG